MLLADEPQKNEKNEIDHGCTNDEFDNAYIGNPHSSLRYA
jgi:hypothetical protein